MEDLPLEYEAFDSLNYFGLSDVGPIRPNNEDVWLAVPEASFFAVADGMGGHKAGEIAAKEAVEYLASLVKQMKGENPLELIIDLKKAIEQANRWVYGLSKQRVQWTGMGTTLCCLIWAKKAIIYAHIGDSRIYRLRGKKLELLTQDHSLLAKWLKLGKKSKTPFPYKNVITRAVGTAPSTHPEIDVCPYLPGDLFFLCSDGLSDTLSIQEMEEILNETYQIEMATKKLIERAKFKGSCDNITVLLVKDRSCKEFI